MCNLFVVNEKSVVPLYEIDALVVGVDQMAQIAIRENDRVCISSEACLQSVYERMDDGNKKRAIDLLKDKFLFRSAIAHQFPHFQFYKTSLEAFHRPVDRKMILKPVKGFFSAGVRVLHPEDDLDQLKAEISREMKSYGAYFSEAVLSTEQWLVEDYIEGEEIAVDLYFGADGSAVILNITQHPMPTDSHYLNAIYWTSKELFDRWKGPLETFFNRLNTDLLQVSHFPLHAEFRIQGDALVPIEINPLRFGGFGLADLPYYSFGLNSYDLFFNDQVPDWEKIWKSADKQFYCWALAYNGKGIDVLRSSPDHQAFLQFCGKEQVAFYRRMDWRKQPVFAIAYLQLKTDWTIQELLSVDFNRFFRALPDSSSKLRRGGKRSGRTGHHRKQFSCPR